VEIIPAIDIRNGRCVRLFQGDYGRETVFSDSPISMALHWVEQGATRLHIVDLDGAKAGDPVNLSLVEEIAKLVPVPVQYGGGVREVRKAKNALSMGIDRVIIGTAAVEKPGIVEELVEQLGGSSLVISVDAREGKVALRGWTRESDVEAIELVESLEASGVERFVYTDITRDGTLTEPNFSVIENLAKTTRMGILVAGGVSSIEQVSRLADIPVEGAIVGTAAYTGDLDLRKAIESAHGYKGTGR